jgi:hypothetical protein
MGGEAKRRKPNGSKENPMAEANEKQTSTFQNWLYRAELGRTTAGSPFAKIIPTNPKGSYGTERQIAACIYEIAAALERASDELKARVAICAQPSDSKITIELSKNGQPWVAEAMIERVLAELNIPVTDAK